MASQRIPMFAPANIDAPAFRDASMTWTRFMGIDPNDPSTFGFLRDFGIAVADEPWVFACVSKLGLAAQGVPLRVYVKSGRDYIPAEDSGVQAAVDYQYVLDNVNPDDMTGTELKGYIAASYSLFGGAYLKKVRGRLLKDVQELYWLEPPNVEAVATNGRRVDFYRYEPAKGAAEEIKPSEVVAYRRFNPHDPLTLLSPLSAVRNEIQVSINASIHTNALLKNMGIPPGAWVPKNGAEIATSDRNLIQRVFKALRGPKNAGKVPVLPVDLQWQEMAQHSADAEWIEARKIARLAICAVLGVPAIVAGDDEKTNAYGNWRDARRSMYQDTVIPMLDGYADALNNWLTPDFDPGRKLGMKVMFDYSGIEALQEPWATQVQAWTMLQDRGAVVPNETRAHFRLGKPVEWGDQPMPYTRLALKGDAMPGSGLGTAIFGTEAVPTPELIHEPGGLTEPGVPDTGGTERAAMAIAALGKGLYQHAAVRSFAAGGDLDLGTLLGFEPSAEAATVIATGLRRRYSAQQIVSGVPGDRFAGLAGGK